MATGTDTKCVIGFLSRLFMDPYQREPANPADFERPVDAKAVESEIKARYGASESGALMLRELSSLAQGAPVTIARAADDYYSLKSALDRPHDAGLHEFGIEAALGSEFLTRFLIRRANEESAPLGRQATRNKAG